MRESYSAGNFSRTRYESLLDPIRSPGRNSSAPTSPITGRKIVCRVDVLITTDLPLRWSSTSIADPSSSSSSSLSMERSSTMLPTRYGSCLLSLTFSTFSLISSRLEFSSWVRRWRSEFRPRISFSMRRRRCLRSSVLIDVISSSSVSSWSPQMPSSSIELFFSSDRAIAARAASAPPRALEQRTRRALGEHHGRPASGSAR
mmetsp:Transcript_1422/g.4298  ORF Transcript_1422/g.4298 Transcript_1422/m.4298 type:complete len:202 (-) Transcript_1422:49-654(-)